MVNIALLYLTCIFYKPHQDLMGQLE